MKTKIHAPTTPSTADPAALAQQATAESALAMREGRYADARALAALADSYARMARRAEIPAGPFDDYLLDVKGEDILREELFKRLDALAAEIEAGTFHEGRPASLSDVMALPANDGSRMQPPPRRR